MDIQGVLMSKYENLSSSLWKPVLYVREAVFAYSPPGGA